MGVQQLGDAARSIRRESERFDELGVNGEPGPYFGPTLDKFSVRLV